MVFQLLTPLLTPLLVGIVPVAISNRFREGCQGQTQGQIQGTRRKYCPEIILPVGKSRQENPTLLPK